MLARRAWLYGSAAVTVVCLLAAPVLAEVTVIGNTIDYYDYGAHIAISLPPCAPQ